MPEKINGSIKTDALGLELEMLQEILRRIKIESTLLIQTLPRIKDDAEKLLRYKMRITD